MTKYPNELKESIVARMLSPNNVSVAELGRETGIPKDTLYGWRSNARKDGIPTQTVAPDELSSEDKFNVVLETATLNEIELGEYCRRKGVFPQQINAWRKVCIHAHAPQAEKTERTEIREQKRKIKLLEGELSRKEKALAEAAALLILQKKAWFLWEAPEDEKSSTRSVLR